MITLKRDHYLDKIRPFIAKPIIKILVGMRRVGKSELLLQIRDILNDDYDKKSIIYINKEHRKFDHIKTNEDLNTYVDQQGLSKDSCILIDEVQEIQHWEKSIASYLSEGVDVYISGSNAHLLSSDLATLLSGRYVEFPIYSLSFNEFCDLLNNDKTIEQNFQLYLKYGGLPGLHCLELEESPCYQYLDAIYQSILLKDIVKRHQVRNVNLLENITKYIFDNIGNLFNPNNVSKYLKSQREPNSLPTVQLQVRYICDAFLAHQVRQFDLKGKRYLEVNDKYYASDLGIRHAILGYKESDIAGMLENLVYLELLRNDYKVAIGKMGTREVDFVCDRKGDRLYIQVSYLMATKETQDREFSVLEKIKDNHPKYVISLDPLQIKRESGVKHINLVEFLQKGLRN